MAPPPATARAPVVYNAIYGVFSLATYTFYNTVEVHGLNNVPPEGEACIIVFNHGNGLIDPTLLISITPRVIRFLAKDTLWDMFIIGSMVRNSGAIPVFRPREHGEKAQDYNVEMYRAAFEALHGGECLAIAPEGVSRFASGMAQPMKTGVARICMQALDLKPAKCIRVLPVGLVYTHREKFRSDVCVQYGKPIVLDATRLPPAHVTKEEREKLLFAQAQHLTEEINNALHALSINAPDFVTLKRALTATRIALPLGTKQALRDYANSIRAWVSKLAQPDQAALCRALDEYQQALDLRKLKDDRVRRFAFAEPSFDSPMASFRHLISALAFGLVALPGCVAWSPMWIFLKRKERHLLSLGPTWNDSIAEMKCLYSWLFMTAVSTLLLRHPARLVALWAWFAVTIRAYEEAIAALRSFYSHRKLSGLDMQAVQTLLRLRRGALELIEASGVDTAGPAIATAQSSASLVRPSILASLFSRSRLKRDWNEILRFDDHNTFEYVE